MNIKGSWLRKHLGVKVCMGVGMFVFTGMAMALTIGTMAADVTKTFADIGLLITSGSYIAGLAFSVGAIMKFKQHKDNPTQIPIGTPISLVLIAASLLFMPTLLKTVGSTMFGSATTAGSTGTSIGSTN